MIPSINLLRRFVSEYSDYKLYRYPAGRDYYIIDAAQGNALIRVTLDDENLISSAHPCNVAETGFHSCSAKLNFFLNSFYEGHLYTPAPPTTPYSRIPEYLEQMARERGFYPPTAQVSHSSNSVGNDVITVSMGLIPYVKAILDSDGDAYIRFIHENPNNTHPVITLVALRILLTECLPPHDMVLPSVGVKTLPPIVIGA